MTYEDIKTVGLAVSNAVMNGDDPADLLDDLSRDELYDLVVATNDVLLNTLAQKVQFKNWLNDVAEGSMEVGPTAPATAVVLAIQVAAELVLS